jgi:hypothetical protein
MLKKNDNDYYTQIVQTSSNGKLHQTINQNNNTDLKVANHSLRKQVCLKKMPTPASELISPVSKLNKF